MAVRAGERVVDAGVADDAVAHPRHVHSRLYRLAFLETPMAGRTCVGRLEKAPRIPRPSVVGAGVDRGRDQGGWVAQLHVEGMVEPVAAGSRTQRRNPSCVDFDCSLPAVAGRAHGLVRQEIVLGGSAACGLAVAVLAIHVDLQVRLVRKIAMLGDQRRGQQCQGQQPQFSTSRR